MFSKTLIDDASNIRIYLDDKEMDYDVTSLDDSWLLHFTYDHSSHEVVISLKGTSDPFDILNTDLFPLLLVLSIIALRSIYVLYVLFSRKKREINFQT